MTRTQEQALKALDGMREIVRAEMLVTGDYVTVFVVNPERVGAVCGGRKACAIGSLWLGAGVKLTKAGELPGAGAGEREDFLRHRPGLRLAYNALNRAATRFAERRGFELGDRYAAPIEDLFECHYGMALTRRDLLGIVAQAKRIVRAA